MTKSLIAEFEIQFQAAAATAQLFSLGLPRDQVLLHTDERGMQPAASSSDSTTVVDETLAPEQAPGRDKPSHGSAHSKHLPATTLRDPAVMGRTWVTVGLCGVLSEDEITRCLKQAGATSVTCSDADIKTPNPAMRPVIDRASSVDVERAMDASRGGAATDRDH